MSCRRERHISALGAQRTTVAIIVFVIGPTELWSQSNLVVSGHRPERAAITVLETRTGITPPEQPRAVTATRPHRSAPYEAVLRIQVLLDRAGFSVGEIDGKLGKNTVVAVMAYQATQHLRVSGVINDPTTRSLLRSAGRAPIVTRVRLTKVDVEAKRYVETPSLPAAQGRLRCMCYESAIEMLGERYHTSPGLLRQINRAMIGRALRADDEIVVPNVLHNARPARSKVARLIVKRFGPSVEAVATNGSIIFHAPASIGANYSAFTGKRVRVKVIVPNPSYYYRPAMFGDRRSKAHALILPAGPNTPVGTVWIGLSEPHLGLHGTPHPATIGYAVSHGCVRMTNSDAKRLASLLKPGVPVEFQ